LSLTYLTLQVGRKVARLEVNSISAQVLLYCHDRHCFVHADLPKRTVGKALRIAAARESLSVKFSTNEPRYLAAGTGAPESGIVSESQIFWYGDNLDVMREHVADESVDLIYLDPPFNSQQVYNRFFGESDGAPSDAQRRAFDDYWQWGKEAELSYNEIVHPRHRRRSVPAVLSQTMEMCRGVLHESNLLAYLSMMAVRLIEMRRVLKPSGALYLHCDPTASHYLKLILDALFDQRNFRSEVIWKRSHAHNSAKRYGPIHDTLLFYSRGDEITWNSGFHGYDAAYLDKHYKHIDSDGRRYKRENPTGAGVRHGETGKPWRGIDPTPKGRHWAKMPAEMDRLDREGLIYWPDKPGAWPYIKVFLDDVKGVPLQDIWSDIDPINMIARERTGYPTQKPVSLLERIISASSNKGDVVLDPFCGCGTAVVAAQKLDRKWIGIDVTHVAVSVLKKRLEEEFPGLKYRVRGEPEDVASARRLADEKWEEFQAWIVDKVGGIPLTPEAEKGVAKKGKDGGIDGYFMFRDDPKAERSKRMVLSVKAGKSLSPEMIDALHGVVARNNAEAGVLLTAYPVTAGMRKTALAYGQYESELFAPGKQYPKIQIVTVEDIFDKRWRGLDYPGSNTSRRSEPPASLDSGKTSRKPPNLRKTKSVPPEQGKLPLKAKRR
jgi:DNA modification methylase